MREIPSLQILCLRAVGSHSCSSESTFAPSLRATSAAVSSSMEEAAAAAAAADANGDAEWNDDGDGDDGDDDETDARRRRSPQKRTALSSASRLLRSYHRRPVAAAVGGGGDNYDEEDVVVGNRDDKDDEDDDGDDLAATSRSSSSARLIPMRRTPCIGPGSSRRLQANEVDLHHPIVGCRLVSSSSEGEGGDNHRGGDDGGGDDSVAAPPSPASLRDSVLVMEYGNPALDCLQSYVDSLVELGRMDDSRLGLHFFEEWRANVLIAAGMPLTTAVPTPETTTTTPKSKNKKKRGKTGNKQGGRRSSSRKKRRVSDAADTFPDHDAYYDRTNSETAHDDDDDAVVANSEDQERRRPPPPDDSVPLGSLSLHNCTISTETVGNMIRSGMGTHLGALDMTGIHGLTDGLLGELLPRCPNLRRLSVKNSRRITSASMRVVSRYQRRLRCLDVGGAYNLTPADVLRAAPSLIELRELHAGGLGWTSGTIDALLGDGRGWTALSFGFAATRDVEQGRLRESLMRTADTLRSLSLPFCEGVVDNTLMGMLGRNLPNLRSMDLRGNAQLFTMTGWYDGRASQAHLSTTPANGLIVLGRYTGLSKSSVEETKRLHPVDAANLVVVLDGTGTGLGITRTTTTTSSSSSRSRSRSNKITAAATRY